MTINIVQIKAATQLVMQIKDQQLLRKYKTQTNKQKIYTNKASGEFADMNFLSV